MTETALTDEIRAILDGVGVATVSASLRKRGYTEIFIEGALPNRPGVRILGTARTLRLIPFRPDLFAEHGGGYNAQKQAFDTVNEGEVLVVEARGVRETGTVGDVLALRAQVRGAAGIVTDGGFRDCPEIAEMAGERAPAIFPPAHGLHAGRAFALSAGRAGCCRARSCGGTGGNSGTPCPRPGAPGASRWPCPAAPCPQNAGCRCGPLPGH